MRKLLSGLTAAVLAGSFAIAAVAPLNAAPIFVPNSEQVKSDVQQVGWRGEWQDRRDWRRHRHWRADRRWRRYARRPYYYDDDYYYYRRHAFRDYYYRRHYRPGVSLYFSF